MKKNHSITNKQLLLKATMAWNKDVKCIWIT